MPSSKLYAMALGLIYFIIFGLIALINGKPADKRDGSHKNGMDSMNEVLNRQDEYDILLRHHENGPRSHREDTTYISPHSAIVEANSASRGSLGENYLTLSRLKSLHRLISTLPSSVRSPERNNILYELIARTNDCKTTVAKCREFIFLTDMMRHGLKEFVDVRSFDSESRCAGDRCGRDRNNKERRKDENKMINNFRCHGNRCSKNNIDATRSVGEYLRCIENRCSLGNDHNSNERNNLRITRVNVPCSGGSGDRCGRKERDIMRCTGDRCSSDSINDNREGRDNTVDSYTLICVGDICTVNRIDNDRDGSNNLQCLGKSCARNIEWTLLDTPYNGGDLDILRCVGDRCSRERIYNNRDDSDVLRCSGDRCSRNRADNNRGNAYTLRCSGDRCSRDRTFNNREDSDVLRCSGYRCNRNREYYNRDDAYTLRCFGDRCSRDRIYNNKEDSDILRCVGDRCSRNRDDYNRNDAYTLRCSGDRCSRISEDYNGEDSDALRCSGDRCSRNSDDYDRSEKNKLRCSGKSCARSRNN